MFAASILRPLVRKHKEKLLHYVLARMGSEVREWRRRSRDRRALAAMSDRALRDIGLTRYDDRLRGKQAILARVTGHVLPII
jgi:uncharacterized protein YjiS (DUF1127 family)